MRLLTRRNGFSLIELLTVIAIIAILAAVIFPVMAMVKNRARENQCMTNLHQISMAAQMFKTDNRRYPDILGARVLDTSKNVWGGSEDPPPAIFENSKDVYLFAEYVKTAQMFHCPSSKITNTRDMALYYRVQGDTSTLVAVHVYDSYDCYITKLEPTSQLAVGGETVNIYDGRDPDSVVEPHYRTRWAPDPTDVPFTPAPGFPAGAATDQQDYERQLGFRNPPGDTVLTWCANHEQREAGSIRGKALVVFADGSADTIDAAQMEASKWRIRPKE